MRHLNGLARQPSKSLVYAAAHIITEGEEDSLEKEEKHWDEFHQ